MHDETQSTHWVGGWVGREGGREGDITASRCWLSAAVLIKQSAGPECPVYRLMIEQSIRLAQALRKFCTRQVVGGGWVARTFSAVLQLSEHLRSWSRSGGGEKAKGKLN